jgi:hypothetical protein
MGSVGPSSTRNEQLPVSAKPMAAPSGTEIQRCLLAPSLQSGVMTS